MNCIFVKVQLWTRVSMKASFSGTTDVLSQTGAT